ncbi:MAG: arginine--tRNA ligase [Alphaproteobacteria bacterium]|nr:arginine--tRNA ligase [Alphaproteobacteria bacterium]
MSSLTNILSDIVGSAFERLGLDKKLGAVRVSDRPDLAQFQCNGALAAAKQAGKNPREVAQAVLDTLSSRDEFEKLEIAGPGFLNITLKDSFISNNLSNFVQKETLTDQPGKGQTVVLDYGGPNIAKAMHVGHLRSSIIGDALRRMCLYAGYNALGDVHMGDWGTPMGQIISELEIRNPAWPYFDAAFTGPYPEESPVSMADLEVIYPAASNACKEDPARLDLARKATLELQDGRPGYRALWNHFIAVSIAGMKGNFEALGVQFDLWKGEADSHPFIAAMVDDLKKRGFAVESEGAVVVPVEQESDKKEMPPLILYKSDGAVMYGTTDLATIVERMQEFSPAKILYVVDQRQSLHFEQVFRAARKSGIAPESTELTHAGFGTMNGPDGKPFKTRAGGVMKLEDLIAMGVEKANARLAEADIAKGFSAEEKADIAGKVAIAAIKFADLQNNRSADYVFDLDRMTSFEGKTGPYLLYQTVRIKSLLRKAEYAPQAAPAFMLQDADRPLALLLLEFPDHFAGALNHYTPHIICDYVFKLAQAFSTFYGQCHILSESDAALKASRLSLCAATARMIETCLDLLGIKVPERM